jgi:hypothetical protein
MPFSTLLQYPLASLALVVLPFLFSTVNLCGMSPSHLCLCQQRSAVITASHDSGPINESMVKDEGPVTCPGPRWRTRKGWEFGKDSRGDPWK